MFCQTNFSKHTVSYCIETLSTLLHDFTYIDNTQIYNLIVMKVEPRKEGPVSEWGRLYQEIQSCYGPTVFGTLPSTKQQIFFLSWEFLP